MAMTLAELRTEVRAEVRDPSGTRWGNTTLRRYLNWALRELGRRSYKLSEWKTAVAAGTASVNRPSDLLYPREAAWEETNGRRELKMKYGATRNQPSETDSPRDLWVVGATLVLDPTPSIAGTLIISGIAKPTEFSLDTDVSSLDDADDALIAGAVYQCRASDGDPATLDALQRWNDAATAWMLADAQRYPMQRVLERKPWWWES